MHALAQYAAGTNQAEPVLGGEESALQGAGINTVASPQEAKDTISREAEAESGTARAWQGIDNLATSLQAVPYVASFLAQLARMLLRLLSNKVFGWNAHIRQ